MELTTWATSLHQRSDRTQVPLYRHLEQHKPKGSRPKGIPGSLPSAEQIRHTVVHEATLVRVKQVSLSSYPDQYTYVMSRGRGHTCGRSGALSEPAYHTAIACYGAVSSNICSSAELPAQTAGCECQCSACVCCIRCARCDDFQQASFPEWSELFSCSGAHWHRQCQVCFTQVAYSRVKATCAFAAVQNCFRDLTFCMQVADSMFPSVGSRQH